MSANKDYLYGRLDKTTETVRDIIESVEKQKLTYDEAIAALYISEILLEKVPSFKIGIAENKFQENTIIKAIVDEVMRTIAEDSKNLLKSNV